LKGNDGYPYKDKDGWHYIAGGKGNNFKAIEFYGVKT